MNRANPRIILVNINDSPNNWDGTDPIQEGNYEAWNFKRIEGQLLGEPQRPPYPWRYYGAIPAVGRVNLARLGGGKTDRSVNDITVVWVVNKKMVVGWYLNATVFAAGQGPGPPHGNKYRAACLVKDGRVLDAKDRTWNVEDNGIRFGTFPRRYTNEDEDRKFRDRVRRYIDSKGTPAPSPKNKKLSLP